MREREREKKMIIRNCGPTWHGRADMLRADGGLGEPEVP